MALDQSALLDLLGQLQQTDVTDRIRSATEKLYQELIDAEATAFIGAAPFERTQARTTLRNGSRSRLLTATAGDLNLKIPKLRAGSFFPSLLERRRRVDQALFAVVMEAYLHGVSTRKVDDLVKALGADTGISKSEVSRICADLDQEVAAFRDRDLSALDYPYVFLDATYCKARVNHRVVSQAVVVAFGVAADGRREVLGFDVGDSENETFWTAFLRSLKARGLDGVKLVISDAHTGLKKAISVVFQGAAWQRCRVHFMRNVLSIVPKASQEMVASIIRTGFAQPDAEHVNAQFEEVVRMLAKSHPKVAVMLDEARADVLAFAGFPVKHWRQIWSTNPMERVNNRDQTTHRRRRRLPQPRRPAATGRRRPRRATRRVGSRRPPLPLRSLHGRPQHQDHPPDQAHRGDDFTARTRHGIIKTLPRTVSRNSTTQRDVTIVDPLLGTRGLMELAGKLRAAVEVAEIGDVHGSMPCVLSAGVTARLQRDPRVWDWVISVRDGAGVVAQMVSLGQARFAVLMDPLVGLPELPGVPEALIADLHIPSKSTVEPLVEALAVMTDTYVPDAYFEIVSEARFGEDPGTSRWQGLYAEVYRSLLPMDPEREHTPEWWAEEWVDAWRTNPDAVRPWFTQIHRGLGAAVSSAVGIPITVQPWSELAWLTDPSAVADALNQEFERPRPDHVEAGALGT